MNILYSQKFLSFSWVIIIIHKIQAQKFTTQYLFLEEHGLHSWSFAKLLFWSMT